MIRFRPFRNGDPPALVDLWNRGLPRLGVAQPLSAHDFDALVMGKLGFEAAGLIVAERDGTPVGFAHAGFGPEQPDGPSHRLGRELGAVAMLVVEPLRDDHELEDGLLAEAERHLRAGGAEVVYAGGQYPLNPFYWGIYGGSEWAGILSSHVEFHRTVLRAGYEPVSTTVLMEADLAEPEARGPKAAIVRRMAQLEVAEDPLLPRWWDALAIGDFHPTEFRLVSRSEGRPLARAVTWDMESFRRADGRPRSGLIALEVDPSCRRQGLGRYLVNEVLRHGREQMATAVEVQTPTTNAAALALYQSAGFVPIETSTLYRRPGGRP